MKKGFTLIEILVVIFIILVLLTLAFVIFSQFGGKSSLDNSAEEIVSLLRTAQNKALTSEGGSQWGVYFSTAGFPHQYVLFKGQSYASRNVLYDEIRSISSKIEISAINLGAGSETVFKRVTGEALPAGNISLRVKADSANLKTIYIENSGLIGFVNPVAPSDSSRVKDSRHVHFDYSRAIDVPAEKITLTFPSVPVVQDIILADNLSGGQIFWEGEINVSGQIQRIKIQSHRLNSPDTQFSIHRDKRYNNKGLTAALSGDGSGNSISYDDAGQTTQGSSIYVSSPIWQ